MKVIVPAYSKTYWSLQPFAYLFNKYWRNESPTVLYYSPIDVDLPKSFELHQIYYKDYPKDKWANGIIEYLEKIDDTSVIIMLEDYWLTRTVNTEIIHILNSLIENNDKILRVDLTTDRLYAGGMRDVGYVEWIDLVEAPKSQYQMSLQAGIWHRKNLLKILKSLPESSRSSWGVELEGTGIINNDLDLRVFGTRQYPVRYENGINVTKGVNRDLPTMTDGDKKYIQKWLENK